MKTLKVIYQVPNADATSAAVEDHGTGANRRELMLVDGKAELDLAPGKYILRWRARGVRPSTEYTIKITAPKEAEFDPQPPNKSTTLGNIKAQKTFTINP
ncbi:MAG TPA: hypothetical protein VF615_11635 [Longimicrobiaceae bacterium]|jgi:hypothetical protein